MRILVAGATGAIGRQLVPRLVAAGNDVAGTTRSQGKLDDVRAMGAMPILLDAFDAEAVGRAVKEFRPEVIVHQMTDLKHMDMRRFEQGFERTNRLRTEALDNLLAAGRAVGARKFVAQSFAGWPFERVGGPVKREDDPLDPNPVPAMRTTLAAIRHLEEAVVGAAWTEGIALRYGGFYGPGTGMDTGGGQLEMLRQRKLPIVGNGAGVWSFIHVADAAEATVAAIERGTRGLYHVTEDEPATVAEWVPVVSRRLGVKPPMRVPRWVGRLLGGATITAVMTEVRGASNAKAKRELGWAPKHSWRRDLGAPAGNSGANGAPSKAA